MGSLDDYDKAQYKDQKVNPPPKLPGPDSPEMIPENHSKNKMPIEDPDGRRSVESANLPSWITALAIALVVIIAAVASYFKANEPQATKVIKAASGENKSLRKQISKLKGSNQWLRHLLKEEKRKHRITKENLATAKEVSRRAQKRPIRIQYPRQSFRHRIKIYYKNRN